MNRTVPHLGGTPKSTSWTMQARDALGYARLWLDYHPSRDFYLRNAVRIVVNHSRRPATRDEARRLLAVLEGRG